jgi:hypothetical protein
MVYAQHMMRKRRGQRWSRDVAQLCVCDVAGDYEQLDQDAVKSLSSR